MERLRQLRRAFPDYDFICWGSLVCGRRYGLIVVSAFKDYRSDTELLASRQWFRDSLQTCLTPGGEMVLL